MRLHLALSVVLMLVTGCCSARQPVHIQVHQTDVDSTLTMEPGDTLEIVLEGNPTTGYQWTARPWNKDVVRETEKPAYESDSKTLGAGGRFIFHFMACGPGKTSLQWIYHRSFEKDVPPVKTFQVNIVVSGRRAPRS